VRERFLRSVIGFAVHRFAEMFSKARQHFADFAVLDELHRAARTDIKIRSRSAQGIGAKHHAMTKFGHVNTIDSKCSSVN
jgi:hypothetical protein